MHVTDDERLMLIQMPDGSTWSVPVAAVVHNRLDYYRGIGKAEKCDENPDDYEIHDWAAGNMDWDDVKAVAKKVADRPTLTPREFQEGWMNGIKRIVQA